MKVGCTDLGPTDDITLAELIDTGYYTHIDTVSVNKEISAWR